MSRTVLVVGAGPGGLVASLLAAAAGADVTLIEKQDTVGGRSGTLEVPSPQGRFRFDIGPTFFLYPQILEEVFAACGERLSEHVDLIRLRTHYDLAFENGPTLRIPSDLPGLQREIAKLSPADAERVPRFVSENRRKLDRFRTVLAQNFDGPRDLLSAGMLRALPLLRPFSSVDGDLGRHFGDPRVRLAFSFQSKYLGMSPYRCPSLFTILAFMEHEYGIFHPRGGTGAVMRAMESLARRMGVRVRTGTSVREILVENGRAVGVRTDDGRIRADAVILNADFARAMTRIVAPEHRKRWTGKRLASRKYSCSAFMLYLGIEGELPEVAHHTIFLSEDFRANFAEIERADAPPKEPSFYLQNATGTDPALAPPGHSTLYVLVPVGNRRENAPIVWDEAMKRRYRAVALARLAKLGIPNLEQRIRTETIVTPTDWEDNLDVHRGAVFNLAHNIGQMLHWRPHNRSEDIERLYVVGGGTHPGSGLPVIFEGARISIRLMTEDLGLRPSKSTMPPVSRPAILEEAL